MKIEIDNNGEWEVNDNVRILMKPSKEYLSGLVILQESAIKSQQKINNETLINEAIRATTISELKISGKLPSNYT